MQISAMMYPNLNAKLEGMYAKKIKRQSLEELIKQNSTKQVMALLKSLNEDFRDLEDNPKRINIKIFLDKIFLQDVQKMERLLNQKDRKVFLEFLSIYEIKCIKSVFRKLSSENFINSESNEIENWIDTIFKNLRGIERIRTQEEFLNFIKKTKYASLFAKIGENENQYSVFEIENQLDQFYFEHMMEIAKNYNASLEDMIGKKIDLNNIIWIFREKKNYDFEYVQVKKTLIKVHYKLKKQELESFMKAGTEKEMIEILRTTYYAKYIDFNNMQNLESNMDKYLYQVYQKYFRSNIFDIGVLYAYFNMIELENNDIMNVVEGIRYHLSKEEIREKLV